MCFKIYYKTETMLILLLSFNFNLILFGNCCFQWKGGLIFIVLIMSFSFQGWVAFIILADILNSCKYFVDYYCYFGKPEDSSKFAAWLHVELSPFRLLCVHQRSLLTQLWKIVFNVYIFSQHWSFSSRSNFAKISRYITLPLSYNVKLRKERNWIR